MPNQKINIKFVESDKRPLKKTFWHQYKVLIIGFGLILFSLIGDYFGDYIYNKFILERKAKKIQEVVFEKEQIAYQIINDLKKSNTIDIESTLEKLLEISREQHIFTYIYQNNKLALYTSNKVMPSQQQQANNVLVTQKLPNGYYLQLNDSELNIDYKILIPVQYNYPIENTYLRNKFLFENDIYTLSFGREDSPDNFNIKSENGHTLFQMKPKRTSSDFSWIVYIYLLGGMLIFSFIDRMLRYYMLRKYKSKFWLLLVISLGLTLIGWRILRFPGLLFESRFFSPEIYASSYYLNSLADLFFNSFIAFWLMNLVYKHWNPKPIKNKVLSIIVGAISFAFLVLCSILISKIINSLVLDSSVTLDMSEFLDLSFFSILCFIVIFFILYTYTQLVIFFTRYFITQKIDYFNWGIILIVPTLLLFFVFRNTNNFQLLQLLYPIIIWGLVILYPNLKSNSINYYMAFILIGSGYVAHQLIKANNDKEHKNRKHIITELANYRDASGEQFLEEKIARIYFDKTLPVFFKNDSISISQLRKHIKSKYFAGYFSRYDFDILSFAPNGFPYKNASTLKLNNYLARMAYGQFLDNNSKVSFINSFDGAPQYMIHLEIFKKDSLLGHIILDLKQKPFLEESVYPELLVEKNFQRSEEIKDYSFAIYNNGVLANQQGNYSYPLLLSDDLQQMNETFTFYKENNFEHLAYQQHRYVTIVMSKEVSSIFNSLSLFSVLFILTTIILSVAFSLVKSKKYHDLISLFSLSYWKYIFQNVNITFKSKIQITILASIFFALVLTGYSTINYIKVKQEKNSSNKLNEEINSVRNDLINYFIENSYEIVPSNKDILTSKIRNLAYLFHADINIFDTDGNLITSSQMPIYDRQIISEKMDAEAFFNLRILQKSQHTQDEKIGGKIIYKSAYALIRNDNNQILYFVNIPYLARQNELKDQITSLIVTTVNLYVFLFLLIILVSFAISNTFTEPLEIIKKHLSGVQVGKINEKISWDSNDEIGSLIQEYNEMIAKVEESALALAKTERESAWREMAKQVAHEIKNPLTPMKLSIQQLIRSWADKDPNIDERFDKTTQVLINRIESLSQIATEFSQFARMPIPINEEMNLEECLKDVVRLFSNTENAKVTIKLNSSGTTIKADKEQLSRAFNNLIKNAIQAIPSDVEGLIEVKTSIKNNLIEVSIKDNGTGIPEEIRDKIFTPNFSTKTSGMGLGLAIVSRIIQNSNGNIWFDTEYGNGTTFFIEFPIHQ